MVLVPLDPQFEQRKLDVLLKADAASGSWNCVFDRALDVYVINSLAPPAAPDLRVELRGVLGQPPANTVVADGGSIDITGTGFGEVNTLFGPPPHTTWRLHNDGTSDLTITAINLIGTSGTGSFPTPNTTPVLSPDPGFPQVINAASFLDIGVDYQNDDNGDAPDDAMSIDSDDPVKDPYNFTTPVEFIQSV